MKTRNQKFKFLNVTDEGKERCPQSFEAWAMESLSGEWRDLDPLQMNRRGMMESNKNQHSFTLDIPTQFEQ